jgi:hypothetical protein
MDRMRMWLAVPIFMIMAGLGLLVIEVAGAWGLITPTLGLIALAGFGTVSFALTAQKTPRSR